MIRDFPQRYWRGEINAFFSALVVVGLGSIVTQFLLSIIIGRLPSGNDLNGYAFWVMISFGLFLLMPIASIWQGVGAWRAAVRHQAKKKKSLFAKSTKVFVVIFFALNAALAGWIIYSAGTVMKKIYDPVYTGRVSVEDDTIVLNGYITLESAKQFTDAMDKNKDIYHFQLNSEGGQFGGGMNIYKAIKARGKALGRQTVTMVAEHCSSSCTIAYLGGDIRLLGPQGMLGFHYPKAFNGFDPESSKEELKTFYIKNGASSGFIKSLDKISISQILVVRPGTISKAGFDIREWKNDAHK